MNIEDYDKPGFDFSLTTRNKHFAEKTSKVPPKSKKTGTTICGVVFNDGVVLGADTRATGGTTVVDKDCKKIHYIAPNIFCCGAGTAADTRYATNLIASKLELLRLQTHKESRVVAAMTQLKRMLYNYQGHISAALVLGGVDVTGPHLHSVHPHGSVDSVPFTALGSGSLAAITMLEARYKDGLNEEEAKQLVASAIRAGVFNDLGSGSNIDLCVIKKGHVTHLRHFETPNEVSLLKNQVQHHRIFNVLKGATEVISETVVEVKKPVVEESNAGDDSESDMDL